ncbi:hypothetical protein SDC9_136697 [bioreactor metagenome]|uniref:Uncharacterized protein n=1 Tax=bioreactor metagenome TaxID=1076179 RepID=A0A645DJY6_9ZZZZ
MEYDNLPKALRENGKFCLWNYEKRQGQEKPAKVPYQINSRKAQPNNEITFTDYSPAITDYEAKQQDLIKRSIVLKRTIDATKEKTLNTD